MKKKGAKKNISEYACPVCGENMIDFKNEDFEYLSDTCPHVVLAYSYTMDDFCDYDGSREEIVDEIKQIFNNNDENEDITMIDIIEIYAQISEGKYKVFSFEDPNSEPPINETVYLLIQMNNEDKTKNDPMKNKDKKR